MFFHSLEQCALGLGRGAIDFVGENYMRENGARMKLKCARFAIEYGNSQYIGRQHVAGELDALKLQSQCGCERMCQRGLADTRNVLNQKVTARQYAGNGETDLVFLAEDNLTDLFDYAEPLAKVATTSKPASVRSSQRYCYPVVTMTENAP